MTDELTRGRASRAFQWKLLVSWLLASLILLSIAWPSILAGSLPDTDDHMRLQQVRDLLSGQSWFDTHQYRMNPPAGAPMHWSRIVDIPLVLLLLPLHALFGPATAETVTICAVPLLTLGCAMLLIGRLTRRFLGDLWALLAALLLPCLTLVWIQLQPLRIDHHGWQIVLGLAAVSALFLPDARRSGLLAGGAAALWLDISIEGLPISATIGALLALRWAITGRDGERLLAYLWSLASLSTLVHIATAGTASWRDDHCDALTYPYLLAFAAVAAGMTAACRWAPGRKGRSAALVIVGAMAIGAIGIAEPQCLNGPFATLDPLVRRFWYVNVSEGLPIWTQAPDIAALVIAYPTIGFAGTLWGWSRANDRDRHDWATLLCLLGGAMAVALMVQRGGGLANALALPGALYALKHILPPVRAIHRTVPRVLATIATLLLLSPWTLPAIALKFEDYLNPPEKDVRSQPATTINCVAPKGLAKLNRLPPANLLTPLDMAPAILTTTHHRLVASGHHRNQAAMKDTILAFTGSTRQAKRIIDARRIEYVVVCPVLSELKLYGSFAKNGFWSQIKRGTPPHWLQRVPLASSEMLTVWRVRR